MKEIFENNTMKILKGIIISIIITLVLLFIYAILLTYTKIEESTIAPAIILITTVSILARKWDTEQERLKRTVL